MKFSKWELIAIHIVAVVLVFSAGWLFRSNVGGQSYVVVGDHARISLTDPAPRSFTPDTPDGAVPASPSPEKEGAKR